jgi:hypothetical protein
MIKIPDSVLKFSDNVDLFKAWGDYFNHYRAVNFGAKKDYDTNVSFEEKTTKLNKAIQAEVNKICGFASESVLTDKVWATNPMYQWAGFAVVSALIDMVIPDVVMDAYGQFSEVRNIGWGDSAVFDIKSSDLFTVTKNGNSRRHVTAQRQFQGQTALIPVNRSITVQTDLYRILCGKENMAEYAMKIALSIDVEIAKDIYAALSNSYGSLTANFKEAAFTQTAFQKLRNRVAAANGGARTYVYGTDVALSLILPQSDYLKLQLGETYNSIGYLPVYLNTSLIALPQKIDWESSDYDFSIADDELFFVASNSQPIVKVVLEGDTITVQDGQFGNANLTMDTTLHKRWIVGIATNAKYGVMKIS